VRALQQLPGVVAEPVGPLEKAGPKIGRRAAPQLVTDDPGAIVMGRALRQPEAVSTELGPDVCLEPVHPGTSELDLATGELGSPGAAAQAIARLDEERRMTRTLQLAGGRHTREATSNDDDVVRASHTAPS
jgi:hypothetical protein